MSVEQYRQRIESTLEGLNVDIDTSEVEGVGVGVVEDHDSDGNKKVATEITLVEPFRPGHGQTTDFTKRSIAPDGSQLQVTVQKRPICPSCETVMTGDDVPKRTQGKCHECGIRLCVFCSVECSACGKFMCQDHRYGYGNDQAPYCWTCLQDRIDQVEFDRKMEAYEKALEAWKHQVAQVTKIKQAEIQGKKELAKQQRQAQKELEKARMQKEKEERKKEMEEERKKEKIRRQDDRERQKNQQQHMREIRQLDLDEKKAAADHKETLVDKEIKREEQEWQREKERRELEREETLEKLDKIQELMDVADEWQEDEPDLNKNPGRLSYEVVEFMDKEYEQRDSSWR
jgi:flagellar biosynthesis GTPase FlhF